MKRVCSRGGKVIVIEVTSDSDKNAACSHVEKLHDCSHISALTLDGITKYVEESRIGQS